VIFLLVLLFRPSGLFGSANHETFSLPRPDSFVCGGALDLPVILFLHLMIMC